MPTVDGRDTPPLPLQFPQYQSIMKRIISILLLTVTITISSHASGIEFYHGTWAEAVAKAKSEDKKIFVDFFTEWCGPCLNMALNVFPLPEVGEAYNKDFVCLKIDAEKGEGVELAHKYGVHSYPSYVFIDPSTEKMIHRSGGNKPAIDFINDIKGAKDPKLSSIYLNEKYASGDYDSAFLIDYIRGKKTSGSRNLLKDFDKLISMGNKLTDPTIWDLYSECITGYDNPYIREISDNYGQFCNLFGKESVDSKLASATQYASPDFIQSLCDFDGKDYNIKIATMSRLFNDNSKTDEAWVYVDKLIADTTVNKKDFVSRLGFYTRITPNYRDCDLTFDQLVKKARYTRYVAYNNYDRDDAMPHYYYAIALEYLCQRAAKEGRQIPADFFATPTQGNKEYSTRHPLLKQKPSYRKK